MPSATSQFSGGVVVATFPGSPAPTAPTDNRVTNNLALFNQPDLFWDQTGTGNVFQGNTCQTSDPAGLCG